MGELSLSEVLPGGFDPGTPPSRRRGAARQARKRRKRRRRRSFLAILLAAVVVGGAIAGAYLGLAPVVRQFTAPDDYTGTGAGDVRIKIPSGASGRSIARLLATAGVVKTEAAFLNAAKKDDRATGIQPGTYQLRRTMSGASALSLLLEPSSRLTVSVTVPEGTRAKDVIALLAKNLGLSVASLTAASTSAAIGLPAAARSRPEGYLFPATYDFPPDVSATEVLQAMVQRAQQSFSTLGIAPSALPDIVIKASIIQAESRGSQYMGKVSRVLANRLAKGMKLQLDSTVSYATGKFNVTTTGTDRASTSRYNTYRYAGLPAGPIDNPGEEALKAALSPTPGPWLFFVTVNPTTGETKFATTPAGHEANVKEFQAWLARQKH